MLALSTRSELAARHGLAPFVRKMLMKGVPAVVVEPPKPDEALNGTPEGLAAVVPKVLAFIGPPAPPADFPEAHLASSTEDARCAAATALLAVKEWMVAVKCRRLIVPIGAPGFEFEADLRKNLTAETPDRASLLGAERAKRLDLRTRLAEHLCRDLHALSRQLDGVTLALMPTSDPLSFLDLETADWIFGDQKHLKLALDTGAVAAAAFAGAAPLRDWFDRRASALGFLLLADHDGRSDGALLPGAGRSDVVGIRDVIGRSLPYAVRCDPRASVDDALASLAETARRLGPVGDLASW